MFTSNFGLSPLEMRLVYLFVFFPVYLTSSVKTFTCEQFPVVVRLYIVK